MPFCHPLHRRPLLLLLTFGLGGLGSGCGPRATPAPAPVAHVHRPVHGGVAVELGEEEYQVEFAYGDAPGTLCAYFMDAELEDYVRLSAPAFAGTARVNGHDVAIDFVATASSATGETVGDTALFTTRADALAGCPALALVIPVLDVKGHHYANIRAELPAGRALPGNFK